MVPNLQRKNAGKNPGLANRTKEEILREFDRLSDKIAQGIDFYTITSSILTSNPSNNFDLAISPTPHLPSSS